jgi:hypothetical protein
MDLKLDVENVIAQGKRECLSPIECSSQWHLVIWDSRTLDLFLLLFTQKYERLFQMKKTNTLGICSLFRGFC